MIISYKHRFIFIKNVKVAGTSVEAAFSEFCGEEDIVTPIGSACEFHKPRNYAGFYNHISAKEILQKIPHNIWNSFFKFTFERNPWDKCVSKYIFWVGRYGYDKSFRRFCLESKCSDYDLYSIDGYPVVDFIGKYESLLADINCITSILNLPKIDKLPKLKTDYRKTTKHYSQYYDDDTKRHVFIKCIKEIVLMGYKFDENVGQIKGISNSADYGDAISL